MVMLCRVVSCQTLQSSIVIALSSEVKMLFMLQKTLKKLTMTHSLLRQKLSRHLSALLSSHLLQRPLKC